MSGTPTPESFSQMYHQVYACPKNPFRHHATFYKFAKQYVDVVQIKIGVQCLIIIIAMGEQAS